MTEGLDYNTQRSPLLLPEYGREIQKMVDHALTITDRAERQRCAETIIATMRRMVPPVRGVADYEHKLWDHLAVMSRFQLDIDWPYDVSEAKQMQTHPEPIPYPMQHIPIRHYGHLVFELIEKINGMAEGPERNELIRYTANQMKRDLAQWGHGSPDDGKVAADLSMLTDGKVNIDLSTFKFERLVKVNDRRKGKKK